MSEVTTTVTEVSVEDSGLPEFVLPTDSEIRKEAREQSREKEDGLIEQKKKIRQWRKNWNDLKKIMAETENAPWQRGDAILTVYQNHGGWANARGELMVTEYLPNGGTRDIPCFDDIFKRISKWSDEYSRQKTQIYECLNVAAEFPPEVRLSAELPYTNHAEALRMIRTLEKKQWFHEPKKGLCNWSQVKLDERRELLENLKAAKNRAKQDGMNFGRSEIGNVVVNRYCREENKIKATKLSPALAKKAKEMQEAVDTGNQEIGMPFFAADAPDEDAVMYLAAPTKSAAINMLNKFLPATFNLREIGKLNVKIGIYELKPI